VLVTCVGWALSHYTLMATKIGSYLRDVICANANGKMSATNLLGAKVKSYCGHFVFCSEESVSKCLVGISEKLRGLDVRVKLD